MPAGKVSPSSGADDSWLTLARSVPPGAYELNLVRTSSGRDAHAISRLLIHSPAVALLALGPGLVGTLAAVPIRTAGAHLPASLYMSAPGYVNTGARAGV